MGSPALGRRPSLLGPCLPGVPPLPSLKPGARGWGEQQPMHLCRGAGAYHRALKAAALPWCPL